MLTVIVAAVAGAIGALAALAFAVPPIGAVLAAAAAFLLVMVWMGIRFRRSVTSLPPSLEPRFRSPAAEARPR
jgi:hypothetical protein